MLALVDLICPIIFAYVVNLILLYGRGRFSIKFVTCAAILFSRIIAPPGLFRSLLYRLRMRSYIIIAAFRLFLLCRCLYRLRNSNSASLIFYMCKRCLISMLVIVFMFFVLISSMYFPHLGSVFPPSIRFRGVLTRAFCMSFVYICIARSA